MFQTEQHRNDEQTDEMSPDCTRSYYNYNNSKGYNERTLEMKRKQLFEQY